MTKFNPYAKSLDGLEILDPVKSFYDYCKERETIRIKRESGESFPWSQDKIFQNGRFLNVFREDDKVSKSIIEFVNPVKDDLEVLIQAVFFLRWCNKSETIKNLSPEILSDSKNLKIILEELKNWENKTAYPVEDVYWKGVKYSRIDAASILFDQIKTDLLDIIIDSNKDVISATKNINKHFQMVNDFPIFMALIDIAWFREELIPITSKVPTGIGAAPYLDILQKFLKLESHQDVADKMIDLQGQYWPNAKRKFFPIDIEYQSCECRKYFSYVNGTKEFKGKNKFFVKT